MFIECVCLYHYLARSLSNSPDKKNWSKNTFSMKYCQPIRAPCSNYHEFGKKKRLSLETRIAGFWYSKRTVDCQTNYSKLFSSSNEIVVPSTGHRGNKTSAQRFPNKRKTAITNTQWREFTTSLIYYSAYLVFIVEHKEHSIIRKKIAYENNVFFHLRKTK